MAETVTDHASEQRYELTIDGELAAIIEYSLRPGSIALNHTETRPGFEGRGAAGRLVRHALADARERGLAVFPFLPVRQRDDPAPSRRVPRSRPRRPARPLRPPRRMTVEVTEGRDAYVGALRVRRALPTKGRRTVGAWCFADHMGPATVTVDHGLDVGPHPHTGIHTVTWLVAGEVLHRDSLGSEQLIAPVASRISTSPA